jgi:small subunit ribosomal protein S5
MEQQKPQTNPGAAATQQPAEAQGYQRRSFGQRNNNNGRDRKPFIKKKEEFQEKVIDLRRVTRVMAGGKRFRFRATLIIGDLKGRVAIGMGKGADVAQSVAKAKNDAKKKIVLINLNKRTIPHQVQAKYSAASVLLKPAKEGNGLIAGGAVRAVLTLVGIKDITAKCLGRTPNKVTNAMATLEALKMLKPAKSSSK